MTVAPVWTSHDTTRLLRAARRLCVVAAVLLASVAAAQATAETTTADAEEPALGIVAVGIAGGFPADRTATLRASLQSGPIGADARLGYGPSSGFAFGAALRGYPPIPSMPVPVWLGAGLMTADGSVRPFVAAGAHVPLAQRLRLDLEAGAAWMPLGLETQLVPHVQVGVSYAFAVTLEPVASTAGAAADGRRDDVPRGCEPTPPDPDRLDAALSDAERRFVRDARATYGSLYRSLRYSLRVTGTRVDGDAATLTLAYDGSVEEIATGRRVSANGRAEASFRWNGCDWTWTGVSY